jgi:hypothetical protein
LESRKVEQVLPRSPGKEVEVAQTMYTHVSKDDKIFLKRMINKIRRHAKSINEVKENIISN